MIREIKTRLSLDGEKEFKSAMAAANREMRVMNADLKAAAAEFANTADKQRYFTERAELAGNKVKQQELIVEALEKAVKDSAKAYGDAARQTDDYRIQLSNATAKLFDMRRASEDANRELEELGRDSGKIGRQIERGIGDAAEDAGEKLDSMFERVQKDVNALKTSVGFQVAAEVGGFVVNAVQGVMGFVEENQELNRQMAIAKYNIEKYDFDWTKSLELVTRAAAITGNQEGALEAINNLVSTQVTNEELIEAAMEGILGVYLTTGGALSLESLAEDLRASVASKKPTGTYAEVLEELIQGIVIEDVEKALSATKSAEEALELATSYLTKAGYQSTTKSFEEQNAELLENLRKQQELSIAWAKLATEITPVVTAIVNGTTFIVDGVADIIAKIKEFEWPNWDDLWPDWDDIDWPNWEDIKTQTQELEKAIKERLSKIFGIPMGEVDGNGETAPSSYQSFIDAVKNGELDTWSGTWDYFIKNLIPSAGAETLPGDDANEAGFQTMQEYVKGMQDAANAEVTAAQAAVATTIAQMNAEEQMQAAFTAGKNAMIEFGNGIAEGAGIPISNVKTMINQINAMLAGMASPAYGLGWGGITGGNIALYMDGQKVGGLVAGGVSRTIGRKVETKMTMK